MPIEAALQVACQSTLLVVVRGGRLELVEDGVVQDGAAVVGGKGRVGERGVGVVGVAVDVDLAVDLRAPMHIGSAEATAVYIKQQLSNNMLILDHDARQ